MNAHNDSIWYFSSVKAILIIFIIITSIIIILTIIISWCTGEFADVQESLPMLDWSELVAFSYQEKSSKSYRNMYICLLWYPLYQAKLASCI